MLDLNDFHLFIQIVERGGFTAASRGLDVSKSTLSYRIAKLENDLGTRLLTRTSRHVSVTEAGRDFYGHALEVLRGAEMPEAVVRQRASEPCGTVRVTASIAAMHYALNDIIEEFLGIHPKVDVVAATTDAMVDIVRLMTDDVCGLQKAAIAGIGIVALPRFLCRDAVRSGKLRLILPEWIAGTGTMTALMPCRQGMLPSVQAFLDHLSVKVLRLTKW